MADDDFENENGDFDNSNGDPNANGDDGEFSGSSEERPLHSYMNSNGQLVLPDGSKLVKLPIQDELKGFLK